MKKSIMTLMGVIMATVGVMAASFTDDDRVINYDELPAAARSFIKQYFPNEQPSYTYEDRDLTHTEYKVVMASGTKLEFNDKGEWRDVECRGCAVPAALVPKEIADYVAKHYASCTVTEISKGRNEWDVKLSNGLEMEFSSDFRLVEVDD